MAAAAALAFTGKSVATASISFWLNKAFTCLTEYCKAEGLEDVKNRVLKSMNKVKAVLKVVDTENIKEKSTDLDAWLWQFRNAVEDAEDAIDELEYYERSEKAKDHKVSDWGSSFAKMKHKVVRSVKNVSILDKTAKQFTRRSTLKRLRKAMESLDKVATDILPILNVAEHFTGIIPSESQLPVNWMNINDRVTGSTLSEPYFVGRETEKERIVQWLARKSDKDSEIVMSSNRVPILSIVGHGGMGKTTLAQHVCEQDDVVRHFKVIWVCVSTRFDVTLITRKIFESLTGLRPSADDFDAVQRNIKQQLMYGKFLLILDDVWEDKRKVEWEKVFAPLRKGNKGSKILVTTRMRSVADMAANAMGVEREYLELQGLQQAENVKLFNHHVFSGLNPQNYEELKPIGDQIAEQLGGCPLVTKVVCGHLQCIMSPDYWDRFLQGSLERFKGTEDGIMEALRLSYNHLPPELQICFRYCSMFPQDYEFKKKDLVLMWMGSGLISLAGKAGNKFTRLEDFGELILFQLTSKSFFELKFKVLKYSQRKEEYYVMHDLMHELASYVSSGECAAIVESTMLENVEGTIRHLRIASINKLSTEDVKKITRFKNLRTIIIDGPGLINKDMLHTVENVIENSKSLRLLRSNLENAYLLPKLADLKHLRYINLYRISSMGICGLAKLYHLLFIDCLTDWGEEPRQARYIGNIDHLRYVNFELFRSGKFPIGRLTSLQELRNYRLQGSKGNSITAVKNLTNLLELEVFGLENVESVEDADNAELNKKKYLNSLSLSWSARDNVESGKDDLILDHLEPHASIRNLKISGYCGARLPVWIENVHVTSLVSLELARCLHWEYLPSFGGLKYLKKLWLERLPNLQQIGQLSNTSRIDSYLPPNLGTLIVRHCKLLTQLPVFPPSLVHLEICKVGLTELPMIGRLHSDSVSTETKQSKLLFVSIEECEYLSSLGESLLSQTQYIETIHVLRINDCKKLESVPLSFKEMSELREFDIKNCPTLRIVSSDICHTILPPSLEKLTIKQCGDLEFVLIESLHGLANLSELVLENCPGLVSLPSADVCKNLKSLKFMEIIGCENLTSFGGLGSLGSLIALKISGCSKLTELSLSLTPQAPAAAEGACGGGGDDDGIQEENAVVPAASSLHVDYLEVDIPSVLNLDPLKSLCHTKGLVIGGGRQMESLPEQWLLQNHRQLQSLRVQGACSLESLPLGMRDLTALNSLILSGAEKLRSLVDLPSTLQSLHVMGCCPELEINIREKHSAEWKKISHIPKVHIAAVKIVQSRPHVFHGGYYFMYGKECSEETFYGRHKE
ncbi:unnamed protein product [Urochloa humidicola]